MPDLFIMLQDRRDTWIPTLVGEDPREGARRLRLPCMHTLHTYASTLAGLRGTLFIENAANDGGSELLGAR